MPRFRVVRLHDDPSESDELTIEADSVGHVLAIIAAQPSRGLIELWRGDSLLGRLQHSSVEEGTFWRLV
jgi:hypothetical protein